MSIADTLRRRAEGLEALAGVLEGMNLLEQQELLTHALSEVERSISAEPRRSGERSSNMVAPRGQAAQAAAHAVRTITDGGGAATTQAVANALGISISSACHRLKAAEEGGLVANPSKGVWTPPD